MLDSLVDYNINDILYSRKEMIQTGIFFSFNLTFFVVLNTHTHTHTRACGHMYGAMTCNRAAPC